MMGRMLDHAGGCTYKNGLVTEAKPGFAKVRFTDLDDLVSDWLAVLHPKTQNDQAVWTLDVGEQVACLLDARMESGCVLGAIYSGVDVPPVASVDKAHWKFSDSTFVEYDRATHVMTLVIGEVTFTLDGNGLHLVGAGISVQGGGVTSTHDQVAGGISQMHHVHKDVVPGPGLTGEPKAP